MTAVGPSSSGRALVLAISAKERSGPSATSPRPSGRDAGPGPVCAPQDRRRHPQPALDAAACIIGRVGDAEARLWRSTGVGRLGRAKHDGAGQREDDRSIPSQTVRACSLSTPRSGTVLFLFMWSSSSRTDRSLSVFLWICATEIATAQFVFHVRVEERSLWVLPTIGDGSLVRYASHTADASRATGDWGAMRIEFLQQSSDPADVCDPPSLRRAPPPDSGSPGRGRVETPRLHAGRDAIRAPCVT